MKTKWFRTVACAAMAVAGLDAGKAVIFQDPALFPAATQQSYRDLALQSPFASVGRFDYTDGGNPFTASGTLINNQWVLTAGHNFSASIVPGNITFNVGGTGYTAEQVIFHPLWAQAPNVGYTQGGDIALVKLINQVMNVTPSSIYTGGASLLNTPAITVGFGGIGTGTTGGASQSDPVVAYAMQNIIDRVKPTATVNIGGVDYTGGLLIQDFDNGTQAANTLEQNNPPNGPSKTNYTAEDTAELFYAAQTGSDPAFSGAGYPTALSLFPGSGLPAIFLEGGTFPGDSGGPTFINNAGSWEIVGITSWGTNPLFVPDTPDRSSSKYGDLNVVTNATLFSDWVAATVPEPSTIWMIALGIGGFALAALRRRILSEKV